MVQSVSLIEKEFLLKTILTTEQAIKVHGLGTVSTCKLEAIDKKYLTLLVFETQSDNPFSVCEKLTIYFEYQGKTYTFESTVRNKNQNTLAIDPPLKIIKSLQRKYIRIKKPKDISVRFFLQNEEISMNYPVCPEYLSVDENDLIKQNSQVDLTALISAFQANIAATVASSTIIMFRTKAPDSFEEKLICATGKVLFIPSTSSIIPKSDPYPEGRIITQQIEEQYEDPNHFIEGTKLSKIIADKKNKGISSEIWCPIVYYQYVVGYIYAASYGNNSFDISMLDYIWDFSRMLAYKLKQSGYFSNVSQKAESIKHETSILDFSPGGMLFSISSSEIRTPIKEGSIINIEINIEKKTIQCTAKVQRKYQIENNENYGLLFLNLSAENVMLLYEFLYQKKLTIENQESLY